MKKNSRNNALLSTYRNESSPKVYSLLVDLVNSGREDLADDVKRVDYLIDYFNACVKKRDIQEARETLERIVSRIDKLKGQDVDTSHLENVYKNIIKINKVKL